MGARDLLDIYAQSLRAESGESRVPMLQIICSYHFRHSKLQVTTLPIYITVVIMGFTF